MIHLNGEFMPIEQAKISVLDRGFIFGDGVYEVIPVYSRRPFRLEEHLARLQASLDAIRLANPHPLSRWTELVAKIVAGNPWDDQNIYLQVTRGAAKRDHAFPKGLKPTVFIMASELVPPSPELVRDGAKAIVLPDFRWLRCDSDVSGGRRKENSREKQTRNRLKSRQAYNQIIGILCRSQEKNRNSALGRNTFG